jgi:hypothetical protein
MADYSELKRSAQQVLAAYEANPDVAHNDMFMKPAAVLALIAENEALLRVLTSSHEFILNDARVRHMCDETGQVSPLFPKRVGILAAITAAIAKGARS